MKTTNEAIKLAPANLPLTDCVFDTDNDNEEEENTMTRETATAILTGIIDNLKNNNRGSAWTRGVRAYAIDLLEGLTESITGGWFFPDDLTAPKILHKGLLNGACNWTQYSWGGSSLIYDRDIAERLCTPSELKKTRNGQRRPNSSEEWLDVQARALYQASRLVEECITANLQQ